MAAKAGRGTVLIERLPAPTMGELSAWLERGDVHILHFVGHGDYDERRSSGVVYFCDQYGRSVAVGPHTLGPFLHDHDPLRLVVLNACRSARVDATDPFGGMAQGLVQHDVTAVVAMQFPISDGAAVAFTSRFYGAVSDGLPLDQAATSARKALLISHPSEWATPVLFLRAPDGRVFDDIVAAQPANTDTAPPETANGAETAARKRRPRWLLAVVSVVLVAAAGFAWYHAMADGGDGTGSGGQGPSAIRTGAAGPGLASVTTVKGPKATAARLTTGLSLDGNSPDWPADAPTFDSNVLVAGQTPTVKATWKLGWDLDYLSFIVTVTDSTNTQTHADDVSQLFQGDGVSFELGTPTPTNGRLDTKDLQVMVGPAHDDPNNQGRVIAGLNTAADTQFIRGTSTVQGLKAQVNQHDHDYVIEAQIPWSTLGVSDPRVGTQFAVNLNVSDAVPDGARRGELRDMVSNNRHRDDVTKRDQWGTLTLNT
ncbi:MAG: CHAT domain-containing protein [Lapillicoccus sp.]